MHAAIALRCVRYNAAPRFLEGMPRTMVDRLHAEVMRAMEQPKVKDILTANAAIPGRMSTQEFTGYLARETRNWGGIVRSSGVKIE